VNTILRRAAAVGIAVMALSVASPATAAEASCLTEYEYYAMYPVTGGDPTFVNQPVYTGIYYYAFTSDFVYCVAGP
jgi:hypothetical protein